MLYTMVILLSVWLLFKMQGTLGGSGEIDLNNSESTEFADALNRLGAKEAFELFLQLSRLPTTLWIFQLFSLLWFPTLVALVSCDCIALDVYRGTLRFILSRASRPAYYFGKLISHLALYCVLQFVSLATVLIYSACVMNDFKVRPYLSLAIEYFLVFIPFLFCTVAATQWISSMSRRPMNALIRIHVLWVAFIFVVAIVPWASPLWGEIALGLFAPFGQYPLWSVIGYSIWGSIFTLAGLIWFMRRDV